VRPLPVESDDACRLSEHGCIMGVHDDCIPYDLPHPGLYRSALYSLGIVGGPEGRCRAIRPRQSAPVPGGGRVLIALPDIDVFLGLTGSNHAHHEAAHRWFNREASAGWATCVDLDGLLYIRYTRFQWLPSRR
jgi:hypothetical protein